MSAVIAAPSVFQRSFQCRATPSYESLPGSAVAIVSSEHPQRRHQDALRLLLAHGRPPQPWRWGTTTKSAPPDPRQSC